MQPYHNLVEQNSLGLAAATASLSSVAQTLVPDDAMSSMTGTLNAVATAMQPYYIAEDKEGALKEIYKHSGGTKPRVQVIGLKAVKPVKLLDLSGEARKTNRFIEHMRFEPFSKRAIFAGNIPVISAISCCVFFWYFLSATNSSINADDICSVFF